ncbi:hypothetical protein D3C83_243670 [compost metagenome]
MKAFDLYLSSRLTTVNSVSRAGRVIARWIARNVASNPINMVNDATIASPRKPKAATTGSMMRATETPNRFIT